MQPGVSRLTRGRRRALLAAVASLLLASCATSETDVPFGLASIAPTPADQTEDFSQPTTNSAASTFVIEEGDPELPDAVASAPVARPELPGETVVAAAPAEHEASIVGEGDAEISPVETASVDAAPVEEQGSTDQEPVEHVAGAAPQPTQFLENDHSAPAVTAAAQPRKRGFLSSFFGASQARAAPAFQASRPAPPQQQAEEAAEAAAEPAKPLIQLASTEAPSKPLIATAAAFDGDALPGVREEGLFEISRRSGLDDDSDIDLHEDEGGDYQVASAAGLARLAPNGLVKQTNRVDVACLKPSLVRVLKTIERHYGRPVVVTSGYRSPDRNRRARGARNSLHMYCAAADVQVAGVSKWDLAAYMRTMPGRGGVGTYCHTNSVHVDVGPERDWNWRCRRRK